MNRATITRDDLLTLDQAVEALIRAGAYLEVAKLGALRLRLGIETGVPPDLTQEQARELGERFAPWSESGPFAVKVGDPVSPRLLLVPGDAA